MYHLLKLEKYRCKFCDDMSKFLDGEGVEYTAVNIEDHPEVASQYGVMTAPVLILLDENEEVVDRVDGFFRDQVIELLESMK